MIVTIDGSFNRWNIDLFMVDDVDWLIYEAEQAVKRDPSFTTLAEFAEKMRAAWGHKTSDA